MEVVFQTEAVTETEAVGEAVTVELKATDAVAEAETGTDVMGATASLSMKRAADAPERKAKGGLTGPVRVGETEVTVTEVRPVAAAEAHAPSSVQTPAAPPIQQIITVSILQNSKKWYMKHKMILTWGISLGPPLSSPEVTVVSDFIATNVRDRGGPSGDTATARATGASTSSGGRSCSGRTTATATANGES